MNNTSIGIIGPASVHETSVLPTGPFRILEGDIIGPFLQTMVPKGDAMPATAPPPTTQTGDEDVQMSG